MLLSDKRPVKNREMRVVLDPSMTDKFLVRHMQGTLPLMYLLCTSMLN
jgi:hypothetical protein